jgi:hypothetical protein
MTETPAPIPNKLKFSIKSDSKKSYNFTIFNKEDTLTFFFEDLADFPVKVYELKITLKELKEKDQNFYIFMNSEKMVKGIKTCIELEKYSLKIDEEEDALSFEMKNEFFENGIARIRIPLKEQDIKLQVECLTKVVANLREELKNYKNKEEELKKNIKEELKKYIREDLLKDMNKEKIKDDTAVNSFEGTSFLNNEEKKLISKWISPNRVLKFNLLFSTSKNGDSTSSFHYYCDGVFPTVTVVLDTSGRRFGGFSTQNWCQSAVGGTYSTALDSFIFNLSNKQKYGLSNKFDTNAIYRHNSYGPTFGGGHDLYLANSCKSNTNSYCNKSSYNTGGNNLLGNSGQTNFQVSYYEVYHVIFE